MRIPLLLVLLLLCSHLYAQRLENIRAEAVNGGEQVIITYDISGASADQKYNVRVYSSHNTYTSPLVQVTGDLNDVVPGTGKRIIWNAKAEMVEYSGDVTFELQADVVTAQITVGKPSSVKKGKTITINYSGVNPGETVKLDLIKGGVVVNQIGTSTDPRKYSWSVPVDVDKGSDYQIKATAGARTATSSPFSVKAKTKAIVYIIPAVVVVGVVVFLVTKSGGGGGKSKDLPNPPDVSTEAN
ncbi:MAG: Ser-Thr-rich GPI-anchored membrane family protein [Bacteroidota bacterium]